MSAQGARKTKSVSVPYESADFTVVTKRTLVTRSTVQRRLSSGHRLLFHAADRRKASSCALLRLVKAQSRKPANRNFASCTQLEGENCISLLLRKPHQKQNVTSIITNAKRLVLFISLFCLFSGSSLMFLVSGKWHHIFRKNQYIRRGKYGILIQEQQYVFFSNFHRSIQCTQSEPWCQKIDLSSASFTNITTTSSSNEPQSLGNTGANTSDDKVKISL